MNGVSVMPGQELALAVIGSATKSGAFTLDASSGALVDLLAYLQSIARPGPV